MYISNTIKTDIVTITPDIARELLGQNTKNRKISRANLARVTAALENGEWTLNGEAIKIARDGRVLDGQHRLYACAETGVPFQTLIVYGLPDETQDTMDTGKSRGAADVLAINGYSNPNDLAAITTGIIRMENWGLRAATYNGAAAYPVTPKQVLQRVESEPELIDLMQYVMRVRKAGLSSKIAGILFYRFSQIDQVDAQFFFDRLISGENLERGNPILSLRELLLNLKTEMKGARNPGYVAAVTIKAWNKFRAGEECQQLRFKQGGANPEKFPEPI